MTNPSTAESLLKPHRNAWAFGMDVAIKIGKSESRIIVTRDLDFGNLMRHPLKSHLGVIRIRKD